jgi:predicted Zn-dependent peptidase
MKTKRIACLPLLISALIFLPHCGGVEKAGPDPAAKAAAATQELANGIKLIVRPHQIAGSPLVTLAFRVKAGINQETPDEVGFSALLARLLGSGGDALRQQGSQLAVELLPDGIQACATVLAEDAGAAAAVLTSALTGALEDRKITAERDRLVSDLEALQAATKPSGEELIDGFLFAHTPFGVSLQEKIDALRQLTPDSFRKFATRCLRPERTVIVAAGAVTVGIVDALKNGTAAWQPAAAEEPFGEWLRTAKIVPIRIIPQPGKDAALLLARRIVDAGPETLYPMLAVNFIINGRSTYSRFTAVQIASALDSPVTSALKLRPGGSCQLITAAVPAGKAAEVTQNIRATLEALYQGGDENYRIMEQEISDARNSLRGGLLRRTETTESLARFILWSEAVGFPSSEVNDHLALIDGIDKDRLLREVAEHFDPSLYILVAVGPEDTLRRQLAPLGEVEVVNP